MAQRGGKYVEGTIRNRGIIYFIMVVLVGVGIYGLLKINKDEFPTFEIKEGLVVGVYPGATAHEVEEQLTRPLEETLFSFSEVDRSTYSYSRDGLCYIYVNLNSPASKRDEELAVHLDMEKLSAYGISPSMLMLDYQTAGLEIMSGEFDTDYATSPIHITSLTGSEQEVAEKIVWSDLAGNVIRLKDIATIERRYEKPSEMVKYNGGTALIISVEMRPDNNIVAFGREVDEVLNEFRATLPDSVVITKVTDQPKVVGTSVWSFVRDLGISMLVVILVMLLLFPFRSAMIAGIAVPVCTIAAIAVMYATNMSLNTVTLAALIAVLGMIVGDATNNFRVGDTSWFPTQGFLLPDGCGYRVGGCGNYVNANADSDPSDEDGYARVYITHLHDHSSSFKVFETQMQYTVKSTGSPLRCIRDQM